MLAPSFRWVDFEDGASLYFNYRLVARVRPGAQRFEVVIQSRRELRGTAASIEQGKRHVERWIAARKGRFPPLRR